MQIPIARITSGQYISDLINLGYVKIRPVVVFPTLSDRESICQGVLCPTVYNTSDRCSGAPYVQSSWFTRPFAPNDSKHNVEEAGAQVVSDWGTYDNSFIAGTESQTGSWAINSNHSVTDAQSTKFMDMANKGSWAEFRHNTQIPPNTKRNAEIQCIDRTVSSMIAGTFTEPQVLNWAAINRDLFYIDQSILTLHSPEIEFNNEIKNLDLSHLKLRIVGSVPLSAFVSDIDIQTSTNPMEREEGGLFQGAYKEPVGVKDASTQGWRSLISAPMWLDGLHGLTEQSAKDKEFGWMYVVYPWHRNGALNNTKTADNSGYVPGMLLRKKLSNLRFSHASLYLDSEYIWKAYDENNSAKSGISDAKIFDSNEVSILKLKSQGGESSEITYYGNVDKIITYSAIGDRSAGYDIMCSGYTDISDQNFNQHEMYINKGNDEYKSVKYGLVGGEEKQITDEYSSIDPISMKYKSTPHAVIALKNGIYNVGANSYNVQNILPTFDDISLHSAGVDNYPANSSFIIFNNRHLFWDFNQKIDGVYQDVLSYPNDGGSGVDFTTRYGFLWLGELYNDSIDDSTRFGGQSPEAFENNLWNPCGEPVSLLEDDGITAKSYISIDCTEGDTYYQRYDCLKTYPFTLEDQNSIVDIVSFMCETRTNIDGRYDKNRGQASNLVMTPTNFNLLNNGYSQQNNYFNYRITNPIKLDNVDFPNLVTWTKPKVLGEDIDTWTNLTLASTLDLDGDKGKLTALRRYNNNIIAFQERGISNILYNEQTQISTTNGVPIEIANSGRVQGKRYISDKIGCTNKWSICEAASGIFFVDSISKDIFSFGEGGINSISDRLGFHSWVTKNFDNTKIWNPQTFDSCVTYYNKKDSELYFITENDCLTYSELGDFTSFYSYDHTPYISTIKDKNIMVHKSSVEGPYKIWIQHEGDYNKFFGDYKQFYTTVIVNPEPTEDKIFNTLEFRSDTWDSSENYLPEYTFDTLTVENEYQKGINILANGDGNNPSNLKKKFRIWRALIPRNTLNILLIAILETECVIHG